MYHRYKNVLISKWPYQIALPAGCFPGIIRSPDTSACDLQEAPPGPCGRDLAERSWCPTRLYLGILCQCKWQLIWLIRFLKFHSETKEEATALHLSTHDLIHCSALLGTTDRLRFLPWRTMGLCWLALVDQNKLEHVHKTTSLVWWRYNDPCDDSGSTFHRRSGVMMMVMMMMQPPPWLRWLLLRPFFMSQHRDVIPCGFQAVPSAPQLGKSRQIIGVSPSKWGTPLWSRGSPRKILGLMKQASVWRACKILHDISKSIDYCKFKFISKRLKTNFNILHSTLAIRQWSKA